MALCGKTLLLQPLYYVMTPQQTDEFFMRRCLSLAANGRLYAKPNPMVGAVIVSPSGHIIGEGWHKRYGEAHAEVNAFASVSAADEMLLSGSTLYVSLEPCAHYGHTPPCADLIIAKKIKRCVCGCLDPFAKVQGRGVQRMREAGVEVTVGVLEAECLRLNHRYICSQQQHRPYIILKWAQSADGYISAKDSVSGDDKPVALSTPYTRILVHRLRAGVSAIVVGRRTLEVDSPQLTNRYWAGTSPQRYVLTADKDMTVDGFTVVESVAALINRVKDADGQSILVEGGTQTIRTFMEQGLWDEIRVECAPVVLGAGTRAPRLPDEVVVVQSRQFDGNTITLYRPADRL